MQLPDGFCIVSGGQTGADRAALDFAIRASIPHGGWCPKGRRAEDGPLPPKYLLEETTSERYDQRTRWNVRDSDATLILTINAVPTGGTALTLEVAKHIGKPVLHISRDRCQSVKHAAREVQAFLSEYNVVRLNVAGPRASQQDDIGEFVDAVLSMAFQSFV